MCCIFCFVISAQPHLPFPFTLATKLIAMRCAGFDRVDTKAAKALGLTVARVPAYSPYAVAEHAISLLMAVNRKTHIASVRVKMANFSLDSGLLGFDIHGKTVAVMGTGKIGQILSKIISGFGVNLLAYDVFESDEGTSLHCGFVTVPYKIFGSHLLFFNLNNNFNHLSQEVGWQVRFKGRNIQTV